MTRKPDRPLAPRIWWIRIRVNGLWQTHGMMKGMATALCGIDLPLHARTGSEKSGCVACKAAGEQAPILTPQMEADWWAKYG